MKISRLALIISPLIALSACEEVNLPQKVFETEKKIVQLESDFDRVTKELAKKDEELTELKTAYETLKNAQENAKQSHSNIPALQVTIEALYNRSENVKHEKDPDDEFGREESEVSVSIDVPVTNVDWLNQLLLNQAAKWFINEEEQKQLDEPFVVTKEMLIKLAQRQFQSNLEEAKEDKPIGLDNSLSSYYLGQRNNIATFSYTYHVYMGGAHGMFNTQYINIDGNKNSVIRLDDLIPPKNQAALKAILWQTYKGGEFGEYRSDWKDEKEFRVPDNFYFNGSQITFVYDVYELGPFAAGNIELTPARYEINALLNPDYQENIKDGGF